MNDENSRDSWIDVAVRCSRTTLERIGDLRRELATLQSESEARRRAQLDRIERAERAASRADRSGLATVGTFALVAASWAAIVGIGAMTPSAYAFASLDNSAVVERAALAAGDLGAWTNYEMTPALDDARTLELPAVVDTTAQRSATPVPVKRVTQTKKRAAKKVAAPTVANAPTKPSSSDLLFGIDDCGDDPICGL